MSTVSFVRARPVPVLLGIIVVLVGTLLFMSMKAFAAPAAGPRFTVMHTVTGARFDIPAHSDATWTLKLWSHGQLLGSESGTSGRLSVALPAPATCGFQADVRVTRPSGQSTRFYWGNRILSACCPSTPPTATASTTVTTVATTVDTSTHRRSGRHRGLR